MTVCCLDFLYPILDKPEKTGIAALTALQEPGQINSIQTYIIETNVIQQSMTLVLEVVCRQSLPLPYLEERDCGETHKREVT